MTGEPETDDTQMPAWVPDVVRSAGWRLVLAVIVGGLGLMGSLYILDKTSDLLVMVLTALFLSFALEPAVNWLAAKGMRRGFGTGLVFLVGLAAFVLILALLIPAIVSGFRQLLDNAPELVEKLAKWLRALGIEISQEELLAELRTSASGVISQATNLLGGIFSVTSGILGGLFRWSAIALFTFYLVAEGPKVRRTVCAAFPPRSQERVLFIWNEAVDQTGGYFYSRLLLALINGAGMFVVLLVFDVPFAAPLALFEGVVAAFVPIIGTYIGGAIPILFAFLTGGSAGIAATAYIVIYQQIENLLLSPRLTARTMSLHPAVAFAAALVGAAMGGILFAFLALPAAGVAQAAMKAWGRRYAVVHDELTREDHPTGPGMLERVRKGMKDRREPDEQDPAPG
ncbi:MAG: AI-2E family transporter [Actinomycetota bacterium]